MITLKHMQSDDYMLKANASFLDFCYHTAPRPQNTICMCICAVYQLDSQYQLILTFYKQNIHTGNSELLFTTCFEEYRQGERHS